MRLRFITSLLFIFSFLGYLEWGQDQSNFIYQAEWDIMIKAFNRPLSVLHPFILLPFTGQVLLFISVVMSRPHRKWLIAGIVLISILYVIILLIGLMELNFKMILSVFPFFGLSAYLVYLMGRHNPGKSS